MKIPQYLNLVSDLENTEKETVRILFHFSEVVSFFFLAINIRCSNKSLNTRTGIVLQKNSTLGTRSFFSFGLF